MDNVPTAGSTRKESTWLPWPSVWTLVPVGLVIWTLWQTPTVISMLSQANMEFMADVIVMPGSPREVTLLTSQPSFTFTHYFEWGPRSFQVEPKPVRLAPESNPLLCTDPSNKSLYQGNILLVPRGNCSFHRKALHAQQMGAAAVIIYNTMSSHYRLNTTISSDIPTVEDIIWPSEEAFDCQQASIMMPTKELSFSPLPYNASHNDPRLSGNTDNLCQQYYRLAQGNNPLPFHEACPSQRCLVAPIDGRRPTPGKATSLQFDFPPEIKVCCALDRHMSMGPDYSMGHDVSVKVQVVFATMQQGDDVLNWIVRHADSDFTASLSSRGGLPEVTSETTLGLSVYAGAVVLLTWSLYWMLPKMFVALRRYQYSTLEEIPAEWIQDDVSFGKTMAGFFGGLYGYVVLAMALEQAAILLNAVVFSLFLSYGFTFYFYRPAGNSLRQRIGFLNSVAWQSELLGELTMGDLIAALVCWVSFMFVSYRLSFYIPVISGSSVLLLNLPGWWLESTRRRRHRGKPSVVGAEGADEVCQEQSNEEMEDDHTH